MQRKQIKTRAKQVCGVWTQYVHPQHMREVRDDNEKNCLFVNQNFEIEVLVQTNNIYAANNPR